MIGDLGYDGLEWYNMVQHGVTLLDKSRAKRCPKPLEPGFQQVLRPLIRLLRLLQLYLNRKR